MVASSDDHGLQYRSCSACDTTFTAAATAGSADTAPRVDKSMAESQHATCECCGLLEECTEAYIDRVRSLFCDHFICGLCAEAVKEEQWRATKADPHLEDANIAIATALQRHMAVCVQFNCNVRQNPALQVKTASAAMRQLLLRRIESCSPRMPKSVMAHSTSCLPAIGRTYSNSRT